MPDTSIVIIGAGAAGLSAAGALQHQGLNPVVLDKDSQIGGTWARRYDRLHLHTIRDFSALPTRENAIILGAVLGISGAATRVDPEVSFDWGTGSPAKEIPVDNFSARWTGKLVAPASGVYTLGATADVELVEHGGTRLCRVRLRGQQPGDWLASNVDALRAALTIDEPHDPITPAELAFTLDESREALLARETLDEREILEVTGLPPAPALESSRVAVATAERKSVPAELERADHFTLDGPPADRSARTRSG